MNRIRDKIEEIQNFLEELETILPKNFEEYIHSIEKKAACERYFEKIIESVNDLAYLIIKKERFSIPEESKSFETLFENKLISEKIFLKLKNAKGMRNIIAHKYGEVEDELIFESLTEELIQDIERFLEEIDIN
ncbi:MAG: DUF86 domain-containing protein [Nanoarchaeota archaeon]